jgi:hypothetical protein
MAANGELTISSDVTGDSYDDLVVTPFLISEDMAAFWGASQSQAFSSLPRLDVAGDLAGTGNESGEYYGESVAVRTDSAAHDGPWDLVAATVDFDLREA